MTAIEVEASRLFDLMREVQKSSMADESVLARDLENMIQELSNKLTKSDNVNDKKLGVVFTFLLWHRMDVNAATLPAFSKLFEFRNGKAILKVSKTDEEVDEKILNYNIRDIDLLSWISLPQPGTPGTMRLSSGMSFVKKIVAIEKGAGGGVFGSIKQDELSQPITQNLIDALPHPDLCVYFAHGKAQESPTDFGDKYEADDEEEELARNNDLDDMF